MKHVSGKEISGREFSGKEFSGKEASRNYAVLTTQDRIDKTDESVGTSREMVRIQRQTSIYHHDGDQLTHQEEPKVRDPPFGEQHFV